MEVDGNVNGGWNVGWNGMRLIIKNGLSLYSDGGTGKIRGSK